MSNHILFAAGIRSVNTYEKGFAWLLRKLKDKGTHNQFSGFYRTSNAADVRITHPLA
jgi:hypothetical protein